MAGDTRMHWPLATPARRTVNTPNWSRNCATMALLSAAVPLPARRNEVMPAAMPGSSGVKISKPLKPRTRLTQ